MWGEQPEFTGARARGGSPPGPPPGLIPLWEPLSEVSRWRGTGTRQAPGNPTPTRVPECLSTLPRRPGPEPGPALRVERRVPGACSKPCESAGPPGAPFLLEAHTGLPLGPRRTDPRLLGTGCYTGSFRASLAVSTADVDSEGLSPSRKDIRGQPGRQAWRWGRHDRDCGLPGQRPASPV